MATLFVDKIDPQSGTSLEIGSSGDTITIPAGATITNNGTQTGFGGTNTPAFLAYASATTSMPNASATKITFGNEIYDTDNAFASSTFTVPVGKAGKYFFTAALRQNSFTSNRFIIQIRKNSTTIAETELSGGVSGFITVNVSNTINLSEGDTVEVYGYQDSGSTQTNLSGENTQFTGFKIIE